MSRCHSSTQWDPREKELALDSFETLLYEERDDVAIVTLNRPEVHNAFNNAMQRECETSGHRSGTTTTCELSCSPAPAGRRSARASTEPRPSKRTT